MKLGLLLADHVFTELVNDYGDYTEMFTYLFESVTSDIAIDSYDITAGHWPVSIHDADAWLITGSRFSVYDNKDWMITLKQWIVSLHQHQKKLIGICFGHQLIAEALGGKVTKADYGWHLGRRSMTLSPSINTSFPDQLSIPFLHQDQVVELPSEAVIIAKTAHCPIAVYQIGNHIASVQGHPEFTDEFSQASYRLREPLLGTECCDQALATFSQPSDQMLVAGWLVNFLKN